MFWYGVLRVFDGEWAFIKFLLSSKARVGRPRFNDELIINGVLYVLTTGWWMDIPIHYGSYKTAWRGLVLVGVMGRIFKALSYMGACRVCIVA